uniref:ORF47 n=1 Tax=Malaco herpesvirus 2 TaxID=3031798 RepID=A0AA48SFE9_9VIRU|nr:TPA_asm: ORF47 [Malaco herpesvirus 2]
MLFVQILCYIISVHRDPKPNNTLLSVPDASGRVRAKIADFGLSKAIKTGRVSVSRALGRRETWGWMSPYFSIPSPLETHGRARFCTKPQRSSVYRIQKKECRSKGLFSQT